MKISFVHLLSLKLSDWLEAVAGCVLVGIMLLTTADVIMRSLGLPILGTYEIVSFGGGMAISLSQPISFREHGQILVDTFIGFLSPRVRFIVHILTRLMGIAMFIIIGWSLVQMGLEMKATGETSAVLKLPYSALLYAMAGAFFAICLTLLDDFRKQGGAQNG